MSTSYKIINRALSDAGHRVEAVKGPGYIYFAGLEDAPFEYDAIPPIMTNSLHGMTKNEFVDHVDYHMGRN